MLECRKIAKNWLRRFKNAKIEFDSISLTDESLVDKENSISKKYIYSKSDVYGLN